jgi:hypothetical protein
MADAYEFLCVILGAPEALTNRPEHLRHQTKVRMLTNRLFSVHSAGLDEGVYIGAWLEAKAFEIRLRSSCRDPFSQTVRRRNRFD